MEAITTTSLDGKFASMRSMGVATTELLFLCIVLLSSIAYFISQKKPKGFPPGPLGLPIVGHLPLLGPEPFKTAIKWRAKYGPIIGVKFGSFRVVIISDYKLAKKAMNDISFSGRPRIPFILDRSAGEPQGIVFTDGKHWQDQRRFALRRLRHFGYGSKTMESIVQDDILELIERFKGELGIPITTNNRFNVAVVNSLWTIMTGDRFKHDDPELAKIIALLTQSIGDHSVITKVASFIPLVAKYAPRLSGYEKLLEPAKPTLDFLQPYIDQHLAAHIEGHPKDFLDSYIDEIKSTKDSESSFHPNNKPSISFALLDLFVAGSETTSSTLTWIFLYLALHQKVQDKLAAEINKVVGSSRLPCLNDRPDMPYTEAVIHEVMRSLTLVPLSLMHSTTKSLEFEGYQIPKDTIVFMNVYEAHNNVQLWGDPENFRPERFLSVDGTKFEKHEGFCPFSIGKRVCLGETLARDELFLFIASLFQAFHVTTDPNSPTPSLEGRTGTVSMTKPHKLIFNLRQQV